MTNSNLRQDTSWQRSTLKLIGLRNAVKTAQIVTEAAWQNKRSMGCHYRADSVG